MEVRSRTFYANEFRTFYTNSSPLKEATWFCNVHSHSSKLRKEREAIYGAEKFEDGASRINKSDMFYGDDGDISDSDLKHLDEVTNNNIQYIEMNEVRSCEERSDELGIR